MTNNPYLQPTRVKAALRTLGVRPTRSMGQNFLVDDDSLAAIVAAAELQGSETVIEVGPGLGVLTWELVQRAERVISVELDRRLIERLRSEFVSAANLKLVESDVLRQTPGALLAAAGHVGPYHVVANLPYAITAPVLRHFLEATPAPERMVVLVQWEVAERICAKPGDLSILAHAVQFYAQPTIVRRVPANAFEPAPAVDSAILALQRHSTPPVAVDDVNAFFRTLKAGFAQPRKKIINSVAGALAAHGGRGERETLLDVLASAGVGPEQRTETITLAEWALIHRALAG